MAVAAVAVTMGLFVSGQAPAEPGWVHVEQEIDAGRARREARTAARQEAAAIGEATARAKADYKAALHRKCSVMGIQAPCPFWPSERRVIMADTRVVVRGEDTIPLRVPGGTYKVLQNENEVRRDVEQTYKVGGKVNIDLLFIKTELNSSYRLNTNDVLAKKESESVRVDGNVCTWWKIVQRHVWRHGVLEEIYRENGIGDIKLRVTPIKVRVEFHIEAISLCS